MGGCPCKVVFRVQATQVEESQSSKAKCTGLDSTLWLYPGRLWERKKLPDGAGSVVQRCECGCRLTGLLDATPDFRLVWRKMCDPHSPW